MANELAIPTDKPAALSTHTGRPLLTMESLVEEGMQRKLLMQYVEAHMRVDTDYGIIPGTKNRTLLKPGAEKLTDLFRCTAKFEIVEKVEDWDRPLIHYMIRCRIVSRETGHELAEGYGSCNSRESKYRYRNAERVCPSCHKPAIIKGKAEYGGGYVCFDKKGGCKAKFKDGDPAIESQTLGKVENPDVADVANTILKMAKKRAHVDASIALARCSDMFTQDAEDLPGAEPVNKPQPAKPVDTEELKRQLKRTGWAWAQAIQAMNQNDGTSYPTTTLPPAIDQNQLANFLVWLSSQPDAAKTTEPANTTEQPKAEPPAAEATPGQPASKPTDAQVQELLALCHQLNKTWLTVRDELGFGKVTPAQLTPEQFAQAVAVVKEDIAGREAGK